MITAEETRIVNEHLWPNIREGIELFHSGVFREGMVRPETGQSLEFVCTPENIHEMVRNFTRFASGDRPVLTPGIGIGHVKDHNSVFTSDGTTQHGQILKVWAEPKTIDGGRVETFLMGDIGLADETDEKVDKGELVRISAEIKRTPPDGCDGEGYTLVRAGLLGFAPAGAKKLQIITRVKSKPNPSYQALRNKSRAAVEAFADPVEAFADPDCSIIMFSDLKGSKKMVKKSMVKKSMVKKAPWEEEDETEEFDPESLVDTEDDEDFDEEEETEDDEDPDAGLFDEEEDMEPAMDRGQLLTWLTANGFDPVALKIDFETTDDDLADLVDVLKRISTYDVTEDDGEKEEDNPADQAKFSEDDFTGKTFFFGEDQMAISEAEARNMKSEVVGLRRQVGNLIEAVQSMNKNKVVLDRESIKTEIVRFCDRMVNEGRMSAASAEPPAKENPTGGEDYADLLLAAANSRVHKFSGLPEKTSLQLKMEAIERREPIYRFSELMSSSGGNGGEGLTMPLSTAISGYWAKKNKELADRK